jgi:hypothetical protein
VDESLFKEAAKNAKKSGDRISFSMPSVQGGYLANGPSEFDYSPFMKCANVAGRDSPHSFIGETILLLGNMPPDRRVTPDYWLGMCTAGQRKMWSERVEQLGDRIQIAVKFGDNDGNPKMYYAFDVEKGFLPARIGVYGTQKDRIMADINLTDALKCSKGRWFPMRSVRMFYPEREGDLITVQETKVIELDVDNRPPGAEFVLKVRAGTHIVDPDKRARFRLKQDEVISLDDIPNIIEKCQQAMKEPLMDTAVHPPYFYWWLRWAGYSVGTLLTAGLLVYVIRRRIRLRLAHVPGTGG